MLEETFNTPFPLFPGNDVTVHKVPGDFRGPNFVALKINKDGTHEVVYSELDSFEEVHTFLKPILAA